MTQWLARWTLNQLARGRGVLPNGLLGMCHWMGLHFHNLTNYNGVPLSPPTFVGV